MFNIDVSNSKELQEALERFEKGEEVTFSRGGRVVARLVPMKSGDREQVRAAVEELLRFRKGRSLGGLSVRDLREEGRL